MKKIEMIKNIQEKINTKYTDIYGNYRNPVMIGDILNYLEKNKKSFYSFSYREDCKADGFTILLLMNWKYKKKGIQSQSLNCIQFIYGLIN